MTCVVSDANDLIELESELTETIARIIDLNLFLGPGVQFYSDATNGSFFISELDENNEQTADSKTVHFCALKIWEEYDNAYDFDFDMKNVLYNSIETLTRRKIRIPFRVILRDELGDEEEITLFE